MLHNTVLMSGSYGSAIEYRFANTTGVLIASNLLDGGILARDGATGTSTGNLTSAQPAMFVDPAAGDLRLKATAASAIDKVPVSANCSSDWDGEARPQGLAADIGADEYTASVAPPPPSRLRIVSP